ncbi:response regulator [Methylopila turkensis]|uniref:Response regulator n=1 Tax=Methylopila turkensis TaxID=1437816 RepID=A0A9W6N817_9HYPH|nr:response regulator [Methylopila turkensis]GLK80951.1 response regulator [Methylopila turkensis]
MRVLIVEDEPIIAMEIEAIVLQIRPSAEIVTAMSVREALLAVERELDLAFLDIDVTDGKTYELAITLQTRKVPFTFVTGAGMADAPPCLKGSALVAKPFSPLEILRSIETAEADRHEA